MTTSLQELLRQRAELDKQIEQVKAEEYDSAILQVRELINRYGFTAREIMPELSRERVRRTRARVEPKYRDAATGKTWTGRGKPPAWIAGQDRAAFLINPAEK